ncbi:MAG: UDP-glucuronic acid dehydrogenase [Gammaproteobacteria bacterium]|nr:UDP-glucuronic acid dehydrogenase [Gammaproteobacteria bacterium]
MKLTILCSSKEHPIFPQLLKWKESNSKNHQIHLINSRNEVSDGDILFLISCTEIIGNEIRKNFKKTLVVHASDLPKGRGWSPHVWSILKGSNKIVVSLLEAEDKVDSGNIWKKQNIYLVGHELFDEINSKIFSTTLELMNFTIENFEKIKPTSQEGDPGEYYPQRFPKDSEIDIKKSILEQFNLLRISDTNRFPCFFNYKGHKYKIFLEKFDDK